jgi:hypothetical protein
MNNINPLDLGFERPEATGLSGNREADFRRHGIPQETKNVGIANAENLVHVFEIHTRLAEGKAELEDLVFLFHMNQAFFHDVLALRERCDELKSEYLKLMYQKKKL